MGKLRDKDRDNPRQLQIALNSLSRMLAAGTDSSDEARDKAWYIVQKLIKRYGRQRDIPYDVKKDG